MHFLHEVLDKLKIEPAKSNRKNDLIFEEVIQRLFK